MISAYMQRPKSFGYSANAVVAILYFTFGVMGLSLAIPPGYASPIFPAAGIAAALMLWSDKRAWPGIWVASFALNLSVSILNGDLNATSAFVACGIACGATLQALFAAYLVTRSVGKAWQEMVLESDIIRTLIAAGVIACIVSASIGVSVLYAGGIITAAALMNSWWSWWVGDTLGVLIVMPIVLSVLYRKHPYWRNRLKTVVITMLLVLLAVAGVVALASNWELKLRKEEIKKHGEAFENLIQQRYIAHKEAIASLARLIEVMPDMTFSQFEYFTRITLSEHPDIFALSYNPYVTFAQRKAFETHFSEIGVTPDFMIKEHADAKTLVAAAKRDFYVPVGFIAPLAGNRDAIGFDINSDATRRDAIQHALELSNTSITAPIRLVQEKQDRIGVLVLHPAYFNRDQAANAPGNLKGFAAGVIKVDELISIATASVSKDDLIYQIDDVSAPPGKQILYRSKAVLKPLRENEFFWQTRLSVADHIWELSVFPTPEYIHRQPTPVAWIISIVGLFFSALLQVLMLVITGRTSLVEKKVREQTRELHLKQDQLQDSNAQLNAMFVLSPDGFVALSAEGVVQYVNPAFEKITGILGKDIINQHENILNEALMQRVQFPEQFKGIAAYFPVDGHTDELTEGRMPVHRELILQHPNKTVLQIIGMRSDSLKVTRILYLRDITSEVEVANLKTEFISHAAHELRTPMTSIYGYIELLLKRKFDEKMRREILEAMQRQAGVIVNMINELLDLARIDARGGKDFTPEVFSLNDLLTNIISDIRLEHTSRNIALTLPEVDVIMNGDAAKIRQSIVNVLTNADKYSAKDSEIEVELKCTDTEAGVQVRDQGIGMSEDQLKHVCERFWRADRSGNIPGTGLGMSIVKEILEYHGGHLSIKSAPGAGTTVTLWFARKC